MFAKLNRLEFKLALNALQIKLLGLKVWSIETAYHMLTRYTYRTGMLAFDVDPEDPAFKKAVADAVADATAALDKKNRELIAEVRAAKRNKDNVDPAELERLESEVDRLTTEITAANKALKTANTRAETAEKSLATESAYTQRLLVDNGLAAALTEAGVSSPHMHKAAAALIRSGQKIEIAVDGEARVAKVGDKALGDFVKAWAQGDEGKAFVAAPQHGGGGAKGGDGKGGGVNPFAKTTLNLTEQGRLMKENPTLAQQLQAEAGAAA